MLFRISLVLACVTLGQGSNCVYDACDCYYNIAVCKNLSSIPPFATRSERFNVTHLMFDAGRITDVGDNSLPPNLTVIEFYRNPISNISRNAFQASSKTLNYLYFGGASFTKLPDALLSLQNLTNLGVFDTRITDWNIPVIQHINKTLTSINVETPSGWPDWLSELTSLRNIHISNSNLTTLPDNAFSNVIDHLYVIGLTNVSLHTIPKAISQLNLTSLSLTHNSLSDVSGIPKALYIDLSYNHISDADKLVAALLPIAAGIKSLYLDSNNLTVIPDLHNINIQDLEIRNNQISDLTKGSLPQSLTGLDLSGNRLPVVPRLVTNLTNVTVLDLSSNLIRNISTTLVHTNLKRLHLDNNHITKLLSSDFPVGSSLNLLDVASNPIDNIPPDAFNNLQNLTDLYLDNTNLTSVPLALTSLVNLQRLSMANTPGLICSCPRDDSLVKWFSSEKLQDVVGTCSTGVNIKDFYTEKDQTCGSVPLASSLKSMLLCFVVLLLLYVFHI